jgi:hypothetical protein
MPFDIRNNVAVGGDAMELGQMVKLKVYGGGEAVLMLVQKNDTHINVCKREELEAAKRERRQPLLVGFPITDVIEILRPAAGKPKN